MDAASRDERRGETGQGRIASSIVSLRARRGQCSHLTRQMGRGRKRRARCRWWLKEGKKPMQENSRRRRSRFVRQSVSQRSQPVLQLETRRRTPSRDGPSFLSACSVLFREEGSGSRLQVKAVCQWRIGPQIDERRASAAGTIVDAASPWVTLLSD